MVTKFDEATTSITKLKSLVDEAYAKLRKINPDNNAPFRSANSENCPPKYWW